MTSPRSASVDIVAGDKACGFGGDVITQQNGVINQNGSFYEGNQAGLNVLGVTSAYEYHQKNQQIILKNLQAAMKKLSDERLQRELAFEKKLEAWRLEAETNNPEPEQSILEKAVGTAKDIASNAVDSVGNFVDAVDWWQTLRGTSKFLEGGVLAIGGTAVCVFGVPTCTAGGLVTAPEGGVIPGYACVVAAAGVCTVGVTSGYQMMSSGLSDVGKSYNPSSGGSNNVSNLDKTAGEIISNSRKGSINREFPGEMRNKTLSEIKALTREKGSIGAAAKKAWKLLTDNRFKK